MASNIPSAAQVRAALEPLGHAQLQELARRSGVSFTTLWSIRSGSRPNPGIDTVCKFMPLVSEVSGRTAARA
jgi:transcriptional regulator with XRE-family HTH domain